MWWAFIIIGLAGKCGVHEIFCFINYQFFEIATLCLPKYACHELNKYRLLTAELVENDFGYILT